MDGRGRLRTAVEGLEVATPAFRPYVLPISLAARQKLMELDDPLTRLQLVDEFLRSRQVIPR